jgi:hypothetical protein
MPSRGRFLRFFALRAATSLKIQGAFIPRRVFTQAGPICDLTVGCRRGRSLGQSRLTPSQRWHATARFRRFGRASAPIVPWDRPICRTPVSIQRSAKSQSPCFEFIWLAGRKESSTEGRAGATGRRRGWKPAIASLWARPPGSARSLPINWPRPPRGFFYGASPRSSRGAHTPRGSRHVGAQPRRRDAPNAAA